MAIYRLGRAGYVNGYTGLLEHERVVVILQLDPPIPMITPRGDGLAHCVIDYGPEHDLLWVVFLDSNGECWTYSNKEVRAQKNITMGRK